MFNLSLIQKYLQENNIDAWLIYDYRGNNPAMNQILNRERKTITHRNFFLIPKEDKPKILVHLLDKDEFSQLDFEIKYYTGWQKMQTSLRDFLKGYYKIATEYSPLGDIPYVSIIDAGTFELLKSFGVEIISSANLLQITTSIWSEEMFHSHLKAAKGIEEVKDLAFDYIKKSIKEKIIITEYDVQEFILKEFQKKNLTSLEMRPIVAVNENSSQPHYQAEPKHCLTIKKEDWVLIDLWAKENKSEGVFVDITWVGYVGKKIPIQYQTIFDIIKTAQQIVIAKLKETWQKNEMLQGWQLDFLAREYITKAGYENYFPHSTGHSLGIFSPHGNGVRLDDFETHDTRNILPNIGFTIEPGIYLKDFGVRLELDVYIDKTKGVIITTLPQNEIVCLG